MLKLNDVKVGDRLIADGGFECLHAGEVCIVKADPRGKLYVACRPEGVREPISRHFLDGQLDTDGETLIGFSKPPIEKEQAQ
ncbi:MAG: hypothetical protein ACM31O_03650 [Bacteroidota bacterium]